MFAHANWQRLLASVLQAASLGLCLITRYRPNLRQEGTSTSSALGCIAVRISRIAADDNPLIEIFKFHYQLAASAQLTSTSTRLTPWQKYCLLPPKELLRLRSLVARGRARERRRLRSKTPREISLLFAPSFPNELFWKVMAFWSPRY